MRKNIQITSCEIKTMDEYFSTLEQISEKNKEAKLWYRGQMDSEWSLIPGLLREAYSVENCIGERIQKPKKTNFSEQNNERFLISNPKMMLKDYRQSLSEIMNVDDLNDVQLLEMSQHYRLPTLLLDWTSDPMVALYFALSGINISDYKRENKFASVWVINPLEINKKTFVEEKYQYILDSKRDSEIILKEMEEDIGAFCFKGTKNNPRICRQSGNFTYTCYKKAKMMDNIDEYFDDIYKIIIPYSVVDNFKKFFKIFDLNEDSIYFEKSKLDIIATQVKQSHIKALHSKLLSIMQKSNLRKRKILRLQENLRIRNKKRCVSRNKKRCFSRNKKRRFSQNKKKNALIDKKK